MDFFRDSIVQPYLGAGIGWAWNKAEYHSTKGTGDNVTFAGMAGFAVDISDNMAIDIGYKLRYNEMETDNWEFKGTDQMIRAGLRFSL